MKKYNYNRKQYFEEYYSQHSEAWKNKYVFGKRFETPLADNRKELFELERRSRRVMDFLNGNKS